MSFVRTSALNVIPGLDQQQGGGWGSGVDLEAVIAFVEENSYEETLKVVVGVPANSYELQAATSDGDGHMVIPAGTTITFPPDSRDGVTIPEYKVGSRVLHVFHEVRGQDWEEVGADGEMSSQIRILRDVYVDEHITFRMLFVRVT